MKILHNGMCHMITLVGCANWIGEGGGKNKDWGLRKWHKKWDIILVCIERIQNKELAYRWENFKVVHE